MELHGHKNKEKKKILKQNGILAESEIENRLKKKDWAKNGAPRKLKKAEF